MDGHVEDKLQHERFDEKVDMLGNKSTIESGYDGHSHDEVRSTVQEALKNMRQTG